MSDIRTRLGLDYDDGGVKQFIADMGAAQVQSLALQSAMTEVVAIAGAAAFAIPLVAIAIQTIFDAANQTSPELKLLDSAFEKLEKRDETVKALAAVLGLTELDAAAALAAAKNNSDYADNLNKVSEAQDRVNRANAVLAAPFSDLRSRQVAQNAIERYGDTAALEREQVMLGITQQRWGDAAQTAGEYYEDIARLSAQRASEEEQLGARLANLAQREAQAFVNAAEQRARAERDAASQSERIARDLADTIERIAEQQSTRLGIIQREYQDREDDLLYQAQRTRAQMADEDLQRERQSSARIEQINRDKARSLEELDFNTHEQLLTAKTRREQEDILRRALFERGMIEQKANDQITDAQRQMAEERQLYAERRKLAEEDYQHQHDINVRETEEKVADAQTAATQQLAVAKKRNEEETSDLKKRLAEQELDIAARYRAEVVAINEAKAALLAASDEKIAKLNQELDVLRQIAAAQFKLVPTGDAYQNYQYYLQRQGEWGTDPAIGGNAGGGVGKGYDTGGVVPGPMGQPKMILAHGGETIVRAGEGNMKEASPQYVFVTVPDVLRGAFDALLEGFTNGHVFKNGVKVIMNDESYR